MKTLALVFSALLYFTPFAQAQTSSMPATHISGAEVLTRLKQGGLILYIRHTSTDFGQNDEQMTKYEDCAHQRNLTDRGRAEAKAIGVAIRRLRIPVDSVVASPYCRTLETARLAFGKAAASLDARGGPAQTESPDRYAGLRRLLSTAPAGRVNAVIVSHGNPFHNVAGPPYLAQGEAAIIQPKGDEGFSIIARVRADEWESLETLP
jgi:phosphohistidine phosphatase SixA